MLTNRPTVSLHADFDSGEITTPFGPVGDLEPCVLITGSIVEWTRDRDAPLCAFARNLLGPGGYARTEGDVMTVNGRERTLRYTLYPAKWDDGQGRVSTEQFYLGVLHAQ